MTRIGTRSTGLMAAIVCAVTASGIATVLSVTVLADHLVTRNAPAETTAASQSDAVNREAKSDRLAPLRASPARIEIKSVEVVGVRDAAVVYRDHDGNVLFRTDPVANVTVVTKNVDLPEVTIRDTAESKVDRLPAAPVSRVPPPPGCESSFAMPSPAALTRITSRCLARMDSASSVASLR